MVVCRENQRVTLDINTTGFRRTAGGSGQGGPSLDSNLAERSGQRLVGNPSFYTLRDSFRGCQSSRRSSYQSARRCESASSSAAFAPAAAAAPSPGFADDASPSGWLWCCSAVLCSVLDGAGPRVDGRVWDALKSKTAASSASSDTLLARPRGEME